MTSSEVIESYVRDVARHLKRDRRNDVALELRELLHDELHARARAAGRPPDRAMAMELLAGFGRPAQVAARYQPRNPLIEPEDNHDFLIWAVVGALAMAALGASSSGIVEWVGILFVLFAIGGWVRRRRPAGTFAWRPRPLDKPAHGGRWPALLAAVGLALFPLALFVDPQAYWDFATQGRGVAGGLAQTAEYLASWQRAATLGCFVLVIANGLVVAVRNGWKRWNRRLSIAGHVGLGVMLLAHAAPLASLLAREPFAIFVAPVADAVARPWYGFAGAIVILSVLYEAYREWVRVEPAIAVPPVSPGATAAG